MYTKRVDLRTWDEAYQLKEDTPEEIGKMLYGAFTENHQIVFDEWNKMNPHQIIKFPTWEELEDSIKNCWIATGKIALEYFKGN